MVAGGGGGEEAPSDQQRCYLAAAVCHLIAGMVRRGGCPTSCAQLSLLLHSAYPAVPILQLGCLIGDLSQPREATTSWGVRDPGGAVHDRTAGSNRNGRQWSRQRAKAAEAWRGGSWGRGQSLRSAGHQDTLAAVPADVTCPRPGLAGVWDLAVSNFQLPLYQRGTSREFPRSVCGSH